MTTANASCTRILDGYAAAVAAKNADALLRLYDPNVRVFDAWDRWTYEGISAWSAAVRQWFESLGDEGVRATFDEVSSSGNDDMVIVSSIVTYTGISAGGEPVRSMQNRLTWAIRSSPPDLRIIHEHTSAPIHHGDMKALLSR